VEEGTPLLTSISSSMRINTRPSNAEAHPGRILLPAGGQRTKRTKKQKEEDDARKREAAIAAKQQAEEERRSVLLQLAESEDAVEQDEEAVRVHTARPDIRYESLLVRVDASVFTQTLGRSSSYSESVPVEQPMDSETQAERDPR
jgi:hypothetical protein